MAHFREYGFDAVISKPLRISDLSRTLHRMECDAGRGGSFREIAPENLFRDPRTFSGRRHQKRIRAENRPTPYVRPGRDGSRQ